MWVWLAVPPDVYVPKEAPSTAAGIVVAADWAVNNSKVVAVGFFTVKLVLFISVIPPTLAIATCWPSVNVCPPVVITTGFDLLAPVIFVAVAVDKLSIIPVAPEVPPVKVSPVVNAPDIAPATLTWANITISNR